MSEWKETEFGKIPIHWGCEKLENHLIIKGRIGWKNLKVSEYLDNGPYIVGGLQIKELGISWDECAHITDERYDESHDIMLRDDDILMTKDGTIGKLAIVRNLKWKATVASHIHVIREKTNEVLPLFLFHFFKSPAFKFVVESKITGSVIPALTQFDINNTYFPLPPLPEQIAMASVLSSLDDKIDLLHRQNATLEKMAETLFRQWFVEEAKEDWVERKLLDEFDCIMGASPPGESYNEEGIGISMFQGNADFEFRFPKKRVYTTDPKRFAEKFDTLISVRAPVGEQNMASEKCCIGRGVAAFRYKGNNEFYTYTYFKMESIMEEIKQFNETGTVFGSISKSDFENLNIVIPDKATVMKFQNEVKPIDDKIISNCTQIRTLTALRDTLLPKLMSGEVRVKTN